MNLITSNKLNIGAPVLDVTTNEQEVVTDGVVTAAGYDPIIITPTVTNMPEGWTPPVVVEKQTIDTEAKFKGNIFESEEDSARVFDPKITILEDEEQAQARAQAAAEAEAKLKQNSSILLVMMIALSVVGLVFAILFVRFLCAYTKRHSMDAQRIRQKNKELEMKQAT